MYENVTFESILQKMLGRISGVDKREGSVVYDVTAPAAIEFMNAYINMDGVLDETFADTASKNFLIKRCNERGLRIEPATFAIRKGEFNIDVPVGSRFSLNQLNYVAVEKIEDGIFKMQCETVGVVGNAESGSMIPIEYIEGLETAKLTDVLIPGEDEEDVEHLRQRYFDSFDAQAFGGNAADYKQKIKAINGVGGVKIYRTPNGVGGTVGAVIIDSTYSKPSSTLVDDVQAKIDPIGNQGEGLGLAPIGHTVTISGCGEYPIHIKSKITLRKEYDWDGASGLIEDAVNEYFKELAQSWEESGENELIVRIAKIESKILDVECVLDVADTFLNNSDENVYVDKDSIPVLKDGVENVQ